MRCSNNRPDYEKGRLIGTALHLSLEDTLKCKNYQSRPIYAVYIPKFVLLIPNKKVY